MAKSKSCLQDLKDAVSLAKDHLKFHGNLDLVREEGLIEDLERAMEDNRKSRKAKPYLRTGARLLDLAYAHNHGECS